MVVAAAGHAMRLEAVLQAVLELRGLLVVLDDLELSDAAAHVDQALSLIKPLHPDVVAGAYGPRPFPARMRDLLEASRLPPED